MRGPRRGFRLLAASAAVALAVWTPLPLVPAAAGATELGEQTSFLRAPWKLRWRTYYSTVFDRGGEYYVTIEMPEEAGAGLGALEIRQISGADWRFSFDDSRTRAFLGQPRREGPPVPVQASFNDASRLFRISFPTPPTPGQIVTVALRPWSNPSSADVYQFSVVAFPAGPNPVAQQVGIARMSIYELVDF
ncbi:MULTISPECIES: DUF2808 domain-containing protein [unclassified Synechococcus]|uniref:DUF2808 domain-containing protein n=1 Tax=unclassified Synechococcus TaxID=2626047 RepID=UPI00006980E7|nr:MULTISPECIES: DUF2808 domain-containing protein [unclassified Synechococcus]EAQ73777.1 hypothetical protein WH5701_10589 [Synechococcus sp. WH 5701]WFN58066.1 DUF2808 domain-containing protein [Synechococcus sp. CCFWC 502]